MSKKLSLAFVFVVFIFSSSFIVGFEPLTNAEIGRLLKKTSHIDFYVGQERKNAERYPHYTPYTVITLENETYKFRINDDNGVVIYKTEDARKVLRVTYRNYSDLRYLGYPNIMSFQDGDNIYYAKAYLDKDKDTASYTLENSKEVVYTINFTTRTITRVKE